MESIETDKNISVDSIFQEAAEEIDAIFNSFRDLHEIYKTSFDTLEESLDELPQAYRAKVNNAKKSFSNMAGTVENKQNNISNKLYAQALVILMGNAESITKELFRNLLRQNVRSVNFKENMQISLKSVLAAANDADLANVVLQKLESESNPADKLNFQNILQMKGIFKGYLDIEVDNDVANSLNKYWQIRHLIIHNGSIFDQRCIDNINKTDPEFAKRHTVGEKVAVSKTMYDACFTKLTFMFQGLDNEIQRLNLRYVHETDYSGL